MNTLTREGLIAGFATLSVLVAAACSSDSKNDTNAGTGGTSSSGGTSSTGGKSSSGGTSTSGGTSSTGGKNSGGGGSTSTGGGGTATGGGDGGPAACDLSATGRTAAEVPNPVAVDLTLTADKVWTIKDITHVQAGKTLTIEPCTRIEGTKSPIGVLVIDRGAKIMAEGDADHPILFTSSAAVGSRKAGDWGGVILLGKAVTNDGDALIEGLQDTPENHYGGSDDADNSGSMKYVRIEYAGYQLAPDVEVNGLTMGAVGSATTISHIEVSHGLDDCFEWFGGTVNADHLICNSDGDDIFDTDRGYRGTIDTAFGRKRENPSADPTGFEWDNNKTNNTLTPISHATAKNVTMCGFGADVGVVTYGMVLRRGLQGTIDNAVVVGFDYGVDTRDAVGTLAAPSIGITNVTFFDMRLGNIANAAETDNDNGFDETAWFTAGTGNLTTDPGFNTADCQTDTGPNDKVTGSAKGAFKDGNWMTGMWVDWETE